MNGAHKWRPSLSMIIGLMIVLVLLLPLAGFGLFRFFENHLIKNTESELIAQSAAIAAIMSVQLEGKVEGVPPLKQQVGIQRDKWDPVLPRLNLLNNSILEERSPARLTKFSIDPLYFEVRKVLGPVLVQTQKSTLAGFRVLDFRGTVIAGRYEIGLSLAHLPEVKLALAGRYGSALRKRHIQNPQPIYSLSRGTSVRVMSALPVILGDRVVGVIYASRTPSNILKELYAVRWRLMLMAGLVLITCLGLGLVFSRSIAGPIRELAHRTVLIGEGDRTAIQPLTRYGSREVHLLSKQMLQMARKMVNRSDYIDTFSTHVSHELKSPLSGIRGALELLSDDKMKPADRARFLANMEQDVDRMTQLIDRLRSIAHAENIELAGACDLDQIVLQLRERHHGLTIQRSGASRLPMSSEAADIIFSNLVENAAQNGALNVTIETVSNDQIFSIIVSDDGNGISEGNKAALFDMFFTTRRDEGGTGIGLGIVRSMLQAHDGDIEILPTERGASFRMTTPVRSRAI